MRTRTGKPASPTPEQEKVILPSEVIAKASGDPEMGGEWDRIITWIFTLDERKTFEKLTEELSFGEKAHRRDYAEIFDALDMATTRTDEASRLHASAKVTLAKYLAEVAEYEGDMREQARDQLEKEKEAKKKGTKTITEADVIARMARMFGDEYSRIETTKAQAVEAGKHIERLLDRWIDRTKALNTMLHTSRKL